MAAPFGPSWRQHARNLSDWFSTWSSTTRNIRAIYDGVVPVALVDRFRDDNQGSLFAINAATTGTAARVSAVAMGSSINDVEVFAVRVSTFLTGGFGVPATSVHIFTPINPYNPVLFPNPVGFFQPGLITNKSFTFGSVLAVAGTNPALPLIFGMEWTVPVALTPAGAIFPQGLDTVYFDPPIRVYRDTTLAVQNAQLVAGAWTLFVSFLYRERPRAG